MWLANSSMAPCTPRRQRRRRVVGCCGTARFRFNTVAVDRADDRWCWVLLSSSSSVVETVLTIRVGARGFGLLGGATTRLDECWLAEDRVVRLWRTGAAALLVVVVVEVEVETPPRGPIRSNPASRRWMDFWVPLLRVVTRDEILLRFTLAPTRLVFWTGTGFGRRVGGCGFGLVVVSTPRTQLPSSGSELNKSAWVVVGKVLLALCWCSTTVVVLLVQGSTIVLWRPCHNQDHMTDEREVSNDTRPATTVEY